jgi:hypothetical protein
MRAAMMRAARAIRPLDFDAARLCHKRKLNGEINMALLLFLQQNAE